MSDYSKLLNTINNCDKKDPLLSTTSLGLHLSSIPLANVSNNRQLLDVVQILNIEQPIPTDKGLARDYRGLAELEGFNLSEIETCFKRSTNPIKSLIDAYKRRQSDKNVNSFVSINDLLKNLEKIERFDVIDDLIPFLIDLANGNIRLTNDKQAATLTNNIERLTIDDTSQHRIYYDAFVCYAPEDIHYAQELISIVTYNDNRAKLATADDLLPGHFEHDALIRLIDERCKKVIIILTPNFVHSAECEFQTKFANEIGIKARYPKIIPVLCENVEESSLPSMIQVLSKINMTDRFGILWKMSITKLLRSLELDSASSNKHQEDAITQFSPITITQQRASNEPVVVLLESQSSTSNDMLALEDRSRTPSPLPSKRGSWLRSFKRRMLGDSTGTTSKMMLLSDDNINQANDSSH